MSVADLPRVLEIAASLPQAPQWLASSYVRAIDPGSLPRRIALTAANTADNTPTGFLIASLVPPEAEVETIAVAQTGQRLGIGRRLLHALYEELRSRQIAKLGLEVRATNHAAIRLYTSEGFVQTGRRTRYYADPDEDAILLGKSLA